MTTPRKCSHSLDSKSDVEQPKSMRVDPKACLTKVPTEILLQIISDLWSPETKVYPETLSQPYNPPSHNSYIHAPLIGLASLSALSRTSKTYHAVATPILYRSFIGSDTANAKFLRTIVSRPDLGALTTNAVFRDLTLNTFIDPMLHETLDNCYHLDPDFLDESSDLVTAVTNSLGLAENHPLMTGDNVLLPADKQGQKPAFDYCPSVTAILILYHLPMLRHLAFSAVRYFHTLEDLFDSWISPESAYYTPPPPFFAELRTFSRGHPHATGGVPAQTLFALMLCPKIEEIRISKSNLIFSERWGILECLRGRRSSVKRICARDSSWNDKCIGHLLDVASSLEDFEYRGAKEENLQFVPKAVGAALQKVKATLRKLVIVVDHRDLSSTRWVDEQGWIGDLSCFSQLRILELSAHLLMRDSGRRSVDTLPPAVEDLELHCDLKEWETLYPLALDMLQSCRLLKRLRLSTFDGRWCMVSDVQREALENAGSAAGVVVVLGRRALSMGART